MTRRITFRGGKDQPIQVGRSNGTKLKPSVTNAVFDCKVLSRLHAAIWCEELEGQDTEERRKFYLKDLHSSNGTYVNKTRISGGEIVQIFSGDVVQFGQDVLDPGTNEKHRCIVATLELLSPAGSTYKSRDYISSG